MSKGPTKNQYSQGLTYVAQKPKFLQNFGKAPSPPPTSDRAGPSRGRRGGRDGDGDGGRAGREPLPERPMSGQWAQGSDDERERERDGDGDPRSDADEWGDVYGGSEDGPQVVVLKSGKHLSAEEVKRERRRAAGKPSQSPPPMSAGAGKFASAGTPGSGPRPAAPTKPQIPKSNTAKRKLVGEAVAVAEGKGEADAKARKKKKAGKGLLSFDEAEGES